MSGLDYSGQVLSLEEVQLLPPVLPGKILGVGLNYLDHIKESGLAVPDEPYIVHRPTTCLNSDKGIITLPNPSHYIQYEGELVVIMGKRCKNISYQVAEDYIFGYTIGNDITDKTFFIRDKHFGIAKAFDTMCPLGPYVENDVDFRHKKIITKVNGTVMQDGNTDNMIFDVPSLIAYLSQIMTLEPGDVIMTGSPSGVGSLTVNSTVEVSIDGLGTLINFIR